VRVADNGTMRVVGRAALTPKHHLALVRLGRRFLVVGVCADRVETVCEIHDPEEVAELAACCGAQAARGGKAFEGFLFRESAEYHEPAGETDEGERRPSPPARGSSGPRPLNDLLHRLRTLRSR